MPGGWVGGQNVYMASFCISVQNLGFLCTKIGFIYNPKVAFFLSL